jgi:hypothetical protein
VLPAQSIKIKTDIFIGEMREKSGALRDRFSAGLKTACALA